jgi:hypothetical protein
MTDEKSLFINADNPIGSATFVLQFPEPLKQDLLRSVPEFGSGYFYIRPCQAAGGAPPRRWIGKA